MVDVSLTKKNNSEEEYFKNTSDFPVKRVSDVEINNNKLSLDYYNYNMIPFTCKVYYSKKDFEILGPLGKGSFAKVVKARNIKNDEIKAIKIINRSFIEKEKKLHEIYVENEVLFRLTHKNIVQLEGVFEENGKIYLVLDYYPNGDFYDFLKNNGNIKD